MAAVIKLTSADKRREMYERRLAAVAGRKDRANVIVGWLLSEAYATSDPDAALGSLEEYARGMNERSSR